MNETQNNTDLNYLIAALKQAKGDKQKQFDIVADLLQYHYLEEDEEFDLNQDLASKIAEVIPTDVIQGQHDLRVYLNEIIYCR